MVEDKGNLLALLTSAATKRELIDLTKYPNPVIRCYSFWALARRQYNGLLRMVIDHILETERVHVVADDEGWHEKAGDFMIEVVTPERKDGTWKKLDQA